MSKNITFDDLQKFMNQCAGQPGFPSTPSIPNALSTLRGFLRFLNISPERKVGATLREDFSQSISDYKTDLEGHLTRSSINNQVALLRQFKRLVQSLDIRGADATSNRTAFQQKLDQLSEQRNDLHQLLKNAGISRRRFSDWQTTGKVPAFKSVEHLIRLAKLLGEEPHALIDLVGAHLRLAPSIREPKRKIKFREKLKEALREPYLLKDWPNTLRRHWTGFLSHKVPEARLISDDRVPAGCELIEALQLSDAERLRLRVRVALDSTQLNNGQRWRLRPRDEYPQRFEDWVNIVGDSICPSAGTTHNAMQVFYGWCTKAPKEKWEDCPQLDKTKLTFGLLTDTKLLDRFVTWRSIRSGGVNGWIFSFLNIVASMCFKNTGYLWQSFNIGEPLGFNFEAQWHEHCEAANAWCVKQHENLLSLWEQTRDVVEPIKHLLDLSRPLQPFRDGVQNYAGVNRKRKDWQFTQSRDVTLLSGSISNPMRLNHWRIFTHRPDGTGHFRRHADGHWYLHIPSIEFKNFEGAAKDDYLQPLSPMFAHYFERYLTEHWPGRDNPKGGLVFVAEDNPDRIWDGLDEQYANITERWISGGVRIRPHSTRYLVGSTILMATQGNLQLAGLALHDDPDTVRKSYAKLLPTYTARGVRDAIGADLTLNPELIQLISNPKIIIPSGNS